MSKEEGRCGDMPGPFSLRGEAGCKPEAGFLAEGFREAALSATLRPSHLRCCRQSESVASPLQWRDRAGFSPASLLSPNGHLRQKQAPNIGGQVVCQAEQASETPRHDGTADSKIFDSGQHSSSPCAPQMAPALRRGRRGGSTRTTHLPTKPCQGLPSSPSASKSASGAVHNSSSSLGHRTGAEQA